VDVDAFIRDGYVVIRGAFDADTAAACRAAIWDSMAGQGVREDDRATWPPLVELDGLAGGSFTDAGTSTALADACDELIGPGRWTSPVNGGGACADAVFWRPSALCLPAAHATGRAGDIYLCHPFIVHTATWPHRGAAPRMIAQPAVHVRDGFAIDGSDPSPVARAIVAGLAMAG
jgi:hypothetical protein